jgi:phospholipase/carboxylesterase
VISRDKADEILHAHQLVSSGAPLTRARAVMVCLHARGADAGSILSLADALAQPDIAFLAPQAMGRAWYPRPFIAPLAGNEPWLTRSLAQVTTTLDALAAAGIPDRLVGLLGFSQGACLAIETAIRRPRAYGAMIGFSGGYIGPMDGVMRTSDGSLAGAQVFLGCSDVDPHIPLARLKETAALMTAMDATVVERIYPGFGHGVNDDEIAQARAILARL